MARHRDDQGGSENRYDEALLSANWNPMIDLLPDLVPASAQSNTSRSGAHHVTEEDADAFLGRIYTFGA